jgi:hypothetical protein
MPGGGTLRPPPQLKLAAGVPHTYWRLAAHAQTSQPYLHAACMVAVLDQPLLPGPGCVRKPSSLVSDAAGAAVASAASRGICAHVGANVEAGVGGPMRAAQVHVVCQQGPCDGAAIQGVGPPGGVGPAPVRPGPGRGGVGHFLGHSRAVHELVGAGGRGPVQLRRAGTNGRAGSEAPGMLTCNLKCCGLRRQCAVQQTTNGAPPYSALSPCHSPGDAVPVEVGRQGCPALEVPLHHQLLGRAVQHDQLPTASAADGPGSREVALDGRHIVTAPAASVAEEGGRGGGRAGGGGGRRGRRGGLGRRRRRQRRREAGERRGADFADKGGLAAAQGGQPAVLGVLRGQQPGQVLPQVLQLGAVVGAAQVPAGQG